MNQNMYASITMNFIKSREKYLFYANIKAINDFKTSDEKAKYATGMYKKLFLQSHCPANTEKEKSTKEAYKLIWEDYINSENKWKEINSKLDKRFGINKELKDEYIKTNFSIILSTEKLQNLWEWGSHYEELNEAAKKLAAKMKEKPKWLEPLCKVKQSRDESKSAEREKGREEDYKREVGENDKKQKEKEELEKAS